jgi:ComF family protein
MTKVRDAIVDIIFPRRCPLCQEIVIPKDKKACYTCVSKLQPIEEPCCKQCGKPIVEQEQEYCFDCVRQKHHYERGFAIYVYEGKIKKSLLDFKFQGKQEYAEFYVEQLIRYTGDKLHKLSLDLILPVPLHPRKQRVRGFNQAELLAQGLAEYLKIPVCCKLLQRTKYTVPQKKLDDKERLHNLEKAFAVNLEGTIYPEGLQGKKILLVDDIYTTGSTIEACTKTLLRAGCAKVFFITVCIGKGF